MPGPGVTKTGMRRAACSVIPLHGDVPPTGVSVGCLATPEGPRLVLAISDGDSSLVAMLDDAEVDVFASAVTWAGEKRQSLSDPRPEPEVRRG